MEGLTGRTLVSSIKHHAKKRRKGRPVLQEVSEMTLNQLVEEHQSLALFVYTPLCGTCKLAERMLRVTGEALPTVPLYQLNINTAYTFAEQWKVTSVPALLLFKKGELVAQHYAISSVAFLYDVLKPLV